MSLNDVPFDEVSEQVADAAGLARFRAQFEAFQRCLGLGLLPVEECRARLATSMVTRAEAELFGVSTPRFCLRVYLGDSFLSLRRSSVLRDRFARIGWIDRRADPAKQVPGIAETHPHIAIPPPGIVADCLLQVPDKYRDSHLIVARELHRVYGEAAAGGAKHLSTPYVQHSWTTSLCGHAAIFMSSMLLHSELDAVHAPSEIAAVLRDPALDEILIIGLSPRHVSKYYSTVGANAPSQICFDSGDGQGSARLANALRAYLFAGMPVIKVMDSGRMSSHQGIYARAGVVVNAHAEALESKDHFVVILGTGVSHERAQEFVFHDPSVLPYMESTVAGLINASSWWSDDHGNGDTCFHFQPVTPKAIRMPLHTWWCKQDGRDPELRSGLYEISLNVYEAQKCEFESLLSTCQPPSPVVGDWSILDPLSDDDARWNGEFRLVQGRALCNEATWRHWLAPGLNEQLTPNVQAQIGTVAGRLAEDHWFWVQRFVSSVWVWDAQCEPPELVTLPEALQVLVAIASEFSQVPLILKGVHGVDSHRPANAASQPGETSCVVPLLSLVTSFTHRGAIEALTAWPTEVPYAEVYAFMDGDIPSLFPPNTVGMSAVEAMASVSQDDGEILRIATQLGGLYRQGRVTIRSFATFMPELAYAAKGRTVALNAIAFLCRLSRNLRLAECGGHDARYIEIVGGSIHEGVVPVTFRANRGLLCVRKPQTTPFDNLLTSMKDLYGLLRETGVSIAIEPEPGPLFSCGKASAIAVLASEIVGRGMQDRIGLNYDTGHFLIMDWQRSGGACAVLPELCPHEPRCQSSRSTDAPCRVVGVHITDHPSAHVADCVPGTFHSPSEFSRSLGRLDGFGETSARVVASVELECCLDRQTLEKAITVASGL